MESKHSCKNIEPLTEHIQFRIGMSEYRRYDAIAKVNFISITELIRNVMREKAFEYVVDEKMRNKLHISSEIEYFFIKKQVISSRNDTNLMKIREILSDFEQILDASSKKTDSSEIEYSFYEVNKLLKIVSEEDTFLFSQIELQAKRIFKHKAIKALIKTL